MLFCLTCMSSSCLPCFTPDILLEHKIISDSTHITLTQNMGNLKLKSVASLRASDGTGVMLQA